MDRLRVVASRLACVLAVLFVVSCSVSCSSQAPAPQEQTPEAVGETSEAVVTALPLFPTGVNASNVRLAIGTVDPHYTITASGDAAHPGPNAIVSTNHPAWVPAAAPAQWLSLDSSECAGCATANFDYSQTFAMPAGANPLTATFTAVLASDDDLDILVNGTLVVTGGGTISYGSTTSRTVGPNVAAFTSGTNTLTFHVHNSGGSFTGLLVQSISGTASGCTADSMCTSAQFCDTGATSCTTKLANGVAIPTIAGHAPALTGVCSAAVGTAVCASGTCKTVSNKCTPAVNGCAADGEARDRHRAREPRRAPQQWNVLGGHRDRRVCQRRVRNVVQQVCSREQWMRGRRRLHRSSILQRNDADLRREARQRDDTRDPRWAPQQRNMHGRGRNRRVRQRRMRDRLEQVRTGRRMRGRW
jgi:hypothetical protein